MRSSSEPFSKLCDGSGRKFVGLDPAVSLVIDESVVFEVFDLPTLGSTLFYVEEDRYPRVLEPIVGAFGETFPEIIS